jgi:phosphatidylglycerol lysyltransferase
MPNSNFSPQLHSTSESLQRVRELVMAWGWNATCYQIINPGIQHWFPKNHDGVIGFVRYNGVRIVAGAPVCRKDDLSAITRTFEQEAADAGERVCYFGAEKRLEDLFDISADHSMVLLGAQPTWQLQHWEQIFDNHASLRAQLHRARNKGIWVGEWDIHRAHCHPMLAQCLSEWLATRGLPPLHFMVEPETLGRLFDRRVFVAQREKEIVGFTIASPVPQRNGWLIEQIIRGKNAPNGTAELMVHWTAQMLHQSGADFMTLGLAPLSQNAPAPHSINPLWLRAVLSAVKAHGRRFYNFDGLDSFKAKFRPHSWDPIYAIAATPTFTPRILYSIASAFSAGSPLLLVLRAVAGAIRTEWKWATHRSS